MNALPEKILSLGMTRNVMREIFEYGKKRKAQVGAENVFDYSLGNPSVPSPDAVNETILGILSGAEKTSVHCYTSAQGDLSNREKLAKSLEKRFGGNVEASDLYFTVGAAAALTITFRALTVPENGDEFVVMAPFFSEYKVFVEGAGGKINVCPPDYETFEPDFSELDARISEKTKGVVINSPNNPSGVVYSAETIEKIASLLREKSEKFGHVIYLITDEPYREIVFGGKKAPWVPDFYDNTIVCYSYSKSLSIPGERIGYIYVPKTVADKEKVYACVCGAGRTLGYVNAPSIFQRVAAACDGLTADISVYERNKDLLYSSLTKMGFRCIEPQGTFYLLLKSPIPDAVKFCEDARKYDLLIVPTDSFYCPGYVRIAFCVETETIEHSLPAFEKLAKEYKL